MVILSFRSKKDKEHLLEKAKKMEEYAAMIVDCIEESKYDDEYYEERRYRSREDDEMENTDRMQGRYGYRRMR